MKEIPEFQRIKPQFSRLVRPEAQPKLVKPARLALFMAVAAIIPIIISLAAFGNPGDVSLRDPAGRAAATSAEAAPSSPANARTYNDEGFLDTDPGRMKALVSQVGQAVQADQAPSSGGPDSQSEAAGAPELPRWRVVGHKIEEGDTLSKLADKYGTNIDSILALNSLSESDTLAVGNELRILTGVGLIHEISSGDTISYLAEAYSVDEAKIVEANNLANPDSLVIGQEIIVPGARRQVRDRVQVAAVSRSSPNRSQTTRGLSGFIWPASGGITSGFGVRWGQPHRGIDIGAPYGSTVAAARSGTVIFTGWNGGYGLSVIIDHGGGITSLYAHLSKILVAYGQSVGQGDGIGLVGSTGLSTGPHLHFEITSGGTRIDPTPILP